jgi:16S rRNA (guanine(966)-N(2))-methyltransferase RsmD
MASAKLRIAGGSARGVPLTEPRGYRLRPTSGLVREAIFNILGDTVTDAAVLDLYAGTGALGIEALSRGAQRAVFIDAEAGACQAMLQSLARTGFGPQAQVLRGRLPAALNTLDGAFDIILMDPPYGDDSADETLLACAAHLAPGGTVVYEHGSKYNPPERPSGLSLTDRRVYGDSALALYVAQEGE